MYENSQIKVIRRNTYHARMGLVPPQSSRQVSIYYSIDDSVRRNAYGSTTCVNSNTTYEIIFRVGKVFDMCTQTCVHVGTLNRIMFIYQLQHGPNEPLDSAFMKAGVRDRRMHAPGYYCCFCSWTYGRFGEQAGAGHARSPEKDARWIGFTIILLT